MRVLHEDQGSPVGLELPDRQVGGSAVIVPGELDITIYQGATWDMPCTWTVDGLVVDLTGMTVRMQVRPEASSGVIEVALTTENGCIAVDNSGSITLSLTATQTAALSAGRYVYDLEVVNLLTVTRVLQGKCYISAEVTR
jgi:hypothetical protein